MKLLLFTLFAAGTLTVSAISAPPAVPDADNTGKNSRDKSGETKTPMDQSNAPEDLKLVKDIRQAVVKDRSLTTTAKNVKIITAGGRVTLRGPVDNTQEKEKIEQIAVSVAGTSKVDNQLEVKVK
jgi:osmotically-inducible protein OsmY